MRRDELLVPLVGTTVLETDVGEEEVISVPFEHEHIQLLSTTPLNEVRRIKRSNPLPSFECRVR